MAVWPIPATTILVIWVAFITEDVRDAKIRNKVTIDSPRRQQHWTHQKQEIGCEGWEVAEASQPWEVLLFLYHAVA